MLVNGTRVSAPYVIRATGDPEMQFRSLNRSGSPIDAMRRFDPAMVTVERAAALLIPAYNCGAPRYVDPLILPMRSDSPRLGSAGKIVRLADGTGVELVAVGSSPDGGGDDWWEPDGTPRFTSPVRTHNRFHGSYGAFESQYLTRSLFFQIHSAIDGYASTTGYIVDPTRRLDVDAYHHGRDMRLNDTPVRQAVPSTGSVVLGFPKSQTRCTYRFGIATGTWETTAVTTLPLRPAPRETRPRAARREYSPVALLSANPTISYQDSRGNNVSQSLLGSHAALGDVARRLVAFDRDGREVVLDEAGMDFHGDARIDISEGTMVRIAELRLQARPYQWAEFRDIALQSGRAAHR